MSNRNGNGMGCQLALDELPKSSRTIIQGGNFMMSDNFDDSEGIDVLGFPDRSKVRLGTPFKIRFTMLLGCLAGRMRLRLQMTEYEIRPNDLLVSVEGAIGECLEISEDARLFIIAFAEGFEVQDMGVLRSSDFVTGILRRPVLHLAEEEMKNVAGIYRMLRERLSDPGFQTGRELTANCIRTIFCYLSPHLLEGEALQRHPLTRGQQLLERFLELTDRYSITHRDLDFYAGRLFVTPKYLSRVVAEVSGRSARSWICMRVILEAKVLLKEGTLTVQQISDRLNFPNQSFFGTFFKRHAGVSPSEYRK